MRSVVWLTSFSCRRGKPVMEKSHPLSFSTISASWKVLQSSRSKELVKLEPVGVGSYSTVWLLTNFWDTPHWWVLFHCSPACLGRISLLLLVDIQNSPYLPPGSCGLEPNSSSSCQSRGVSQWDERDQAWPCFPHRCGWEAHSNMYIPVSSSGIQLLLERPLLTTSSPLSSSWGPCKGRRK